MSMAVRLAAQRRLARRGEEECDTARTVPKPSVELAGASVVSIMGVGRRDVNMSTRDRKRVTRMMQIERTFARVCSIAGVDFAQWGTGIAWKKNYRDKIDNSHKRIDSCSRLSPAFKSLAQYIAHAHHGLANVKTRIFISCTSI
jgi:hypothetical protein